MSFSEEINLSTFTSDINIIPTPLMLLNFSLDGGFPETRWIETFGPEGVGKTSLNLQICSLYLELFPNSYMMFIDAERSLMHDRIKQLFYQDNVEINEDNGAIFIDGKERGIIVSPDTYEQVDLIFSKFSKYCINNNLKGIFIWDSLVALTSEAGLEKGKTKIGFKAASIQDLIERYNGIFKKANITQLVINQIRQKIADMFASNKDSGEMTEPDIHVPGGNAHKFFSMQSYFLIKSKKWGYPKSNPIVEGRIVRLLPTKNKIGLPKREVNLVMLFEIGFSDIITQLEFLNNEKQLKGKGLSRFKFPFMTNEDKSFKINTFCEELVKNEEFAKKYFDFVFTYMVQKFKSFNKISKFKQDLMYKAMILDAKKLVKYFSSIDDKLLEEREDLISSIFGNPEPINVGEVLDA